MPWRASTVWETPLSVVATPTEAASVGEPLYITIPDHLTVRCFGQPQPDARVSR